MGPERRVSAGDWTAMETFRRRGRASHCSVRILRRKASTSCRA